MLYHIYGEVCNPTTKQFERWMEGAFLCPPIKTIDEYLIFKKELIKRYKLNCEEKDFVIHSFTVLGTD